MYAQKSYDNCGSERVHLSGGLTLSVDQNSSQTLLLNAALFCFCANFKQVNTPKIC